MKYVAIDTPPPRGLSLKPSEFFWMATPPKITVFTASGTYTPSPGIVGAILECIGGGGGGGATVGSASAARAGGGGGAGSYARKAVSTATLGASQTVTI